MKDDFEKLEEEVLRMLFEGDEPTLAALRFQLQLAKRNCREMSGTGFFTHFKVPVEAPRLPNNPSFKFGDVTAELEGLQHGAGFMVFIDDGLLTMLEGYAYDEAWPPVIGLYNLAFMGKPYRDWKALRNTPGWPSGGSSTNEP